jgi:flagellar basal-body rod protein FlgF
MDKALYVAMTGASEALRAQAANAHNLANVSTVGFRADLTARQAVGVAGEGFQSRVNALLASDGWDRRAGALMQTGGALDVAVRAEDHWIAVQDAAGGEAYTRAGDLRLSPQGQLTTAAGRPVLGEGAPIAVPPHQSLTVGEDGTISVVPQGQGPETLATVGRIRVMQAEPGDLVRGDDGLMRLRDGATAIPVAGPSVMTGVLEGSNVNPAEALVNMIQLARQFEMQMRVMRTAEDNDKSSASLMRVG